MCLVQIKKMVSGGQTGVDRAALDAALELGVPCGGWCPAGRLAEDGVIAARYPLIETPSAQYAQRTEWNVRDSDGTLVLSVGKPSGGTALTIAFARKLGRPCLVVDLREAKPDPAKIFDWLRENKIEALNVAGPRASHAPGVHERARKLLGLLLKDR
jgi:predicted Rossmann fold nucleotide-binding protein DprA/Smf involved in DNA uptake